MITKLTADKARERIAHLTSWREQRGLTLREEEYLEAMEMALILLTATPCWWYGAGGFYNTPKAAEKDGVSSPSPLYFLEGKP